MIDFDNPRAVRLRAFELTEGMQFCNDDGRIMPLGPEDRLRAARMVETFIMNGGVSEGGSQKPLTMYDIGAGDSRPVTQLDVDRWLNWTAAHGAFMEAVKEANDALTASVREVAR